MDLRNRFLVAGFMAAMAFGGMGEALAQSASQELTKDSALETIKKRGAMRVWIATFVP